MVRNVGYKGYKYYFYFNSVKNSKKKPNNSFKKGFITLK